MDLIKAIKADLPFRHDNFYDGRWMKCTDGFPLTIRRDLILSTDWEIKKDPTEKKPNEFKLEIVKTIPVVTKLRKAKK